MQLLSQRQMLNKTVTVALLLLFSAGLLTAKEKAFSLKKFKQTDIGNPALAGSSQVKGKGIRTGGYFAQHQRKRYCSIPGYYIDKVIIMNCQFKVF